MRLLHPVFASIGLTLLPPRCGVCSITMPQRLPHRLCAACHEVLECNLGPRCQLCDSAHVGRCTAAFVRLRAPYIYGGGLQQMIVAAKFHEREDLATALGHLLWQGSGVPALCCGKSAVIPVPLGAARRRQRGYNQAAAMARVVAQAAQLPLRHALRRVRNTTPQSDLTLAERQQNVQQAFDAHARLQGHILLVDDVVTSTATVHHAAQAALAAGASAVTVLAVARAAA